MKVGFIGLGKMGFGMAANLLKAGHSVTVFNRTVDRARPLGERGAVVAHQVSEACAADAVFTMLADDAAVEGMVFGDEGVLRHLPAGALHISSSTISMGLTARLASAHRRAGQGFVAAPVFGRPSVAESGELAVIAAGASEAINRARPLFEVIGRRTFVVSERPETAAAVKLSGNFLIASMIEGLGEAIALADRAGIDRRAYLKILTSTLFPVPLYENYGGMIADRRFEPAGFAVPLGAKDLRLFLAAAESLRVPTPLAGLLRDRLETLLAQGGEHLDWAALGFLPARESGEGGVLRN